jgi:hypothetical protein
MLHRLGNLFRPSKGRSLARAFSRLGWVSFWIQLVVGSALILGIAYYFVFSRAALSTDNALPFVAYLTLIDLLIMAFTTFWSYRYTRLGRRLVDPERRPADSYVIGTVWTGVIASVSGMVFSMIIMLIEAAKLLFFFLKTPQAGVPVIQTTGGEAAQWVSAVDMISLMALILTLFAELFVLMCGLWLLFQATLGSPDFPQATGEA